MTAEEIIAEVRLLVSDMAIRGACPGEVSPSLKYRITDFLHRAGTPFAPWRDHRKYLTKTRTAICDGKEVPCQVHKAVVDDTAGELCREIAQCLMVSKWMLLPESKDWTADRAELAIKDAVARLPELCDKLEATKTRDDEPPKPPAAPKGEGTPVDDEAAKAARYAALLVSVKSLANDRLVGKQCRVVELLVEAGGRKRIADVATDAGVGWDKPYKTGVDGFKKGIKLKLTKLGAAIKVVNQELRIVLAEDVTKPRRRTMKISARKVRPPKKAAPPMRRQ